MHSVMKIKDNDKDKVENHAISPIYGEYTLCGLAFEGDGESDKQGRFSEAVHGEGRINCPRCIEIIQFCKNLKI